MIGNELLSQADIYRAYVAVFNSPAGSIVLEDLKNNHHFYGTTVPGVSGPIDPVAMALAEGERNVVLRILRTLETKESDYVSGNGARG